MVGGEENQMSCANKRKMYQKEHVYENFASFTEKLFHINHLQRMGYLSEIRYTNQHIRTFFKCVNPNCYEFAEI